MASQDIVALVQGIQGPNSGGVIRVKSFSIGYSAPLDAEGEPGSVALAPVTITKIFDITSPSLMQEGGKGTVFGTIVLTSTSAPGHVQTITLTNARITDWRLVDTFSQDKSLDNAGVEQVTFAAQSMTLKAQKMGADLKLSGDPVSGSVSSKQ